MKRRGPLVYAMRMGCSECDCVVERGERVVVCGDDDCCCSDVPVRDTAT